MNKKKYLKIDNFIKKNNAAHQINFVSAEIKKLLLLDGRNVAELNDSALYLAGKKMKFEALIFLEKAFLIAPNNHVIISNIANVYLSLSNFEKARSLFEKSISIEPDYMPPYLNLGSLYHHLGDYTKSINLMVNAISKWPSIPELHVNLAVGLLGLDLYQEALISLETSLILRPNYCDALLNIATIESIKGNRDRAIKIYEDFLNDPVYSNHEKIAWAKYKLSYEYFFKGNLKKGWDFYQFGFDNSIAYNQKRRPERIFKNPKWRGESLDNKTLLVWAEQGLGDEVIYLSIFDSLVREQNKTNLILECDVRLHEIIRRTYPSINVRPPSYDIKNYNRTIFEDFDYQIPMADLGGIYRDSMDKFYQSKFQLVVDEVKKERFKEKLLKFEGKFKIGISWRSGILNKERNKNYTAIKDWGAIFAIKNAIFVNLQYGDCESELLEVEEIFNIKVIRWTNLDIKNHLDEVFALMSNLDLAVSADTSAFSMAAAVNLPVCVYQPKFDWNSFGTKEFPFLPFAKLFVPKDGMPLATTLTEIAKYIELVKIK